TGRAGSTVASVGSQGTAAEQSLDTAGRVASGQRRRSGTCPERSVAAVGRAIGWRYPAPGAADCCGAQERGRQGSACRPVDGRAGAKDSGGRAGARRCRGLSVLRRHLKYTEQKTGASRFFYARVEGASKHRLLVGQSRPLGEEMEVRRSR